MKIALKNFFRNNICNLTIASIRHFIPDSEIHCLCQFKASIDDYLSQEPLNIPESNIFYSQSKYINLGPSVANQWNNLFFTEGYNIIFDRFKDSEEPLLMLAEDHFFTSGATLKELLSLDSTKDVAYAGWGSGANGSILWVRPSVAKNNFPMLEEKTSIEHSLYHNFIRKFGASNIHQLSTRNELDYRGDGKYSNDYNEIKGELIKAGILT